MINFNLGSNQKEAIRKFVNEEIEIDEFKSIISTWKSNADNALAHLTNPYYYGLEFTESPCQHFANLPDSPFYNFYLYTRMNLFALQQLEQGFKYKNKYIDEYLVYKESYDGIEKTAVDFIEGTISFNDYVSKIKSFNDYKNFLSKHSNFGLSAYKTSYDLNNFEVSNLRDVYTYHFSLYNSLIAMGLKVFPTFKYINLTSLASNLTLKYEMEHPELNKNLHEHIFNNISLDEVVKVNDNFEQIFEEKLGKIIEEFLPDRPTENSDYRFVNEISWPKNKDNNRLHDIISISRVNEKVEFLFKDKLTQKEQLITYIDGYFITKAKEENSLEEALVLMEKYVAGEKELYQNIVKFFTTSNIRVYDYDGGDGKIVLHPHIMKSMENCARHRLQLVDLCIKVLSKHKIKAKLNDVFESDYLNEREKPSKFKIYQDYVEGFVSAEQFVSAVKDDNDFKSIYQHTNYPSYGNAYEKSLFTDRLSHVLSKTSFNTFDKHFLSNSAYVFLRINNEEVYNKSEYYAEFNKLSKYGLNYVGDSIMFDYIEKFLTEMPKEITKAKDIEKYIKDELKKIYTYEKSYPQWFLGAKWQYTQNNTPMHFVGAKPIRPYSSNKKYTFKDKLTGEIFEVEDTEEE